MIFDLSVDELQRLADVTGLDTPDSPGALFLLSVQDAYNDEREYSGRPLDRDTVSELADSLVPVYVHERWQLFVDLGAYNEDVSGQVDHDMTNLAGIAVSLVAARLLQALADEDAEDEA